MNPNLKCSRWNKLSPMERLGLVKQNIISFLKVKQKKFMSKHLRLKNDINYQIYPKNNDAKMSSVSTKKIR